MYGGIFKLPSYIRIEVDEYELEQFVTRRYEGRFGEPPLKVEAARYPSEIDIVIYVGAMVPSMWVRMIAIFMPYNPTAWV